MTKGELDEIKRGIDRIRAHVLIFEESIPNILTGARMNTKSAIMVFSQAFPHLRHVVEFADEAIPLIYNMIESLPQRSGDIPKAAADLMDVTRTTELAATEVMDAVEQVEGASETMVQDVEKILASMAKRDKDVDRALSSLSETKQNGLGKELGKELDLVISILEGLKGEEEDIRQNTEQLNEGLDNIGNVLFGIMDALQFQDITAQRIEGVRATLDEIHRALSTLCVRLADFQISQIDVKRGTYDTRATYDRAQAQRKQNEIDDWFGGKTEKSEVEQPQVDSGEPAEQSDEEASVPSQEDIDALFAGSDSSPDASTQEDAASDKSTGGTETSDQADIDALFAAGNKKKSEEASEEEKPGEASSQDDIDALFAQNQSQ